MGKTALFNTDPVITPDTSERTTMVLSDSKVKGDAGAAILVDQNAKALVQVQGAQTRLCVAPGAGPAVNMAYKTVPFEFRK